MTEASATVDTGGNGGNFGSASVVLSGQDPTNLIGAVCGPNYNVIVGVAGTTGANANYSNWVTFN